MKLLRLFSLLLCLFSLTACERTLTSAPRRPAPSPTDTTDTYTWNTATRRVDPDNTCPTGGVPLQVLGSGGPIADDERASSAYLLWYQGRAIALVDAGGGAFQRFGTAGANLEQLDLIALSHLHTDHSADLPALLKGAYFSSRSRPLTITGPSAGTAPGGAFPALDEFLRGLFAPSHGVYRYLSGLLDGSDGLFALDARTLNATPGHHHQVAVDSPVKVSALGVHHGIVPALAYRLEVATDTGRRSVVFAGDQSADNPDMVEFARGADILVAHVAIPPDAGEVARRLHRTPAAWGELAAAAEVPYLLLSHWMQRSLAQEAAVFATMDEKYPGTMLKAADLACIVL